MGLAMRGREQDDVLAVTTTGFDDVMFTLTTRFLL